MKTEDLERITRVTADNQNETTSEQISSSQVTTWWSQYESVAGKTLSETAIRVLEADCEYIVDQGIFGAGEIGVFPNHWPDTRLRRGLVMGSVQSGKTASLIGVAAKCLDRGGDIVIILAGTRLALWRQTFERILFQLDGWTEEDDSNHRLRRIFLPNPAVLMATPDMPSLDNLYNETPNLVRRRLVEKKPLIAVVMKHADHLMCFSRYLHKILEATYQKSDRPLHLLVIDDEADDGSVLDSTIEAGLAPDSDGLKQLPRHVARLWAERELPHQTINSKLFATYIAYTATPQANFLQNDHNPLSPSDFVVSLRTPSDDGPIPPSILRTSTYLEPLGLPYYYTGGEFYYSRISSREAAICSSIPFPVPDDHQTEEDYEASVEIARQSLLSDSLRAYFVAGALRLLGSNRKLSKARTLSPSSLEYIRQVIPAAHSMLFHPSARIESHFAAAREIVLWSAQYDPTHFSEDGAINEDLKLSVKGLSLRLQHEEAIWKKWLCTFELTRANLSFLPLASVTPIDIDAIWPEIYRILIEEIFPYTRISIINSNPRADDRPHFEPEPVSDDLYVAPRDIHTIFVSGNVMARGLTLEGLTTTLFLRSSNEPLADTQMQMQRWFGYRGSYLHLCRVFMFEDQLQLFRTYHENDEALRREIITEMNEQTQFAPSPLVLQGRDFRATGKIANLRTLPLCPGSDPFVRILEHGKYADHNANILTTLLDKNEWADLIVGKTNRGILMKRRLSLIETAELLESFRYTDHSPSPDLEHHQRWRAIGSEIDLPTSELPLFRPPFGDGKGKDLVPPPQCPYSIAAYLRLWNAMLTRRARGMFPTDNRDTPWSMINLSDYAKSAPRFYVGIRYGAAGNCSYAELSNRGVMSMTRSARNGLLYATWGSRNPGEGDDAYLGDQLFDYHEHQESPPQQVPGEPNWRPRGAPGLILFHLINSQDQPKDAVAIGLGIPIGGPDHFAALRPA